MTYKTSLDRFAKVTSIAISILFAAIIILQISFINFDGNAVPLATSFTLLLIYFGTFSFRPVNYKLTENELIIHRPLSDVSINRKEIKTVEQLDKTQLEWSWRIFGVGGLFGYWGKFTNKKLGSMTWYTTRKNKAVLIQTIYNKKIVISPDEPEKFVADYLQVKQGNT